MDMTKYPTSLMSVFATLEGQTTPVEHVAVPDPAESVFLEKKALLRKGEGETRNPDHDSKQMPRKAKKVHGSF